MKLYLANAHIGGTIPWIIRAQNAAILFTRSDKHVQVEAFELSPSNETIMTTKGRLQRQFPGRALLVKEEIFSEAEFQVTIAGTLSKMSSQVAVG